MSQRRALIQNSIITSKANLNAVVVGVQLSNEAAADLQQNLDELESLLATLGICSLARVVQKRQSYIAKSLMGEGKVSEIKQLAKQHGCSLVVFNNELSPMQVRNLETMTGLKIYDRSTVILQIFFEHARTPQAKTQLEIARLEYLLPRLTGAWTHFHRQKGGFLNSKGMGETQIEIDRRRARQRINKLQKQLEQIRKEKKTQSKARRNQIKVALVGYTNSGKTTLMNALTKSDFKAKDELFATLDASIRVIDPRTRPKILLSDTVGFIKNLPHSLVESFKTTLDHVQEADLLLHVVDASSPNFREQIEITEQVLGEIGAAHIPALIVFNKIDQVADRFYGRIIKQGYKGSIVVSANNLEDILRLRDHIYDYFVETMQRVHLVVPQDHQEAVSFIYKHCKVFSADYSEANLVHFEVQGTETSINKLAVYNLDRRSENEDEFYSSDFAENRHHQLVSQR